MCPPKSLRASGAPASGRSCMAMACAPPGCDGTAGARGRLAAPFGLTTLPCGRRALVGQARILGLEFMGGASEMRRIELKAVVTVAVAWMLATPPMAAQ